MDLPRLPTQVAKSTIPNCTASRPDLSDPSSLLFAISRRRGSSTRRVIGHSFSSSQREENGSWVPKQHFKAFPYPYRYYCRLCVTGCGMITCPICKGAGTVVTKPGGAGVVLKVGKARCKACHGIGVIPCSACAGCEMQLSPPDPENGPKARMSFGDEHLSIYDWLAQFGG